MSKDVQKWGRPLSATRWHIFKDLQSLCGQWAYNPNDEPVDPKEDEYREGEDCKECCRKAGLLEE